MAWNNPLTAIQTNDDNEFNFVFKDGKTSDAPFSYFYDEVVNIDPLDSIVRKIIVGYDQSDYVSGFKLFDAKDTCVLEIGGLSY